MHTGQRFWCIGGLWNLLKICYIQVGCIAGLLANRQRIFANRSDIHELMCHLASHHPGVTLHSDQVQPQPCPNAVVGIVVCFVLGLKALKVFVQRIRVFHDKLTYTDESSSGARLIPKFCLHMVDHLR